jgi:hypothetical protein
MLCRAMTHDDGSRTRPRTVATNLPWDPRCLGTQPELFNSVLVLPRADPVPPLSSPSGGDEETRTPDPLLAKEMLCQLSYVPIRHPKVVVGVSGLEPETSALSGQCSNQLS